MFYIEKNIVAASCTLYFFLIIVKSLQLHGRRQIAESRRYFLVRVIVFLWRVFSLFLFLTGWEFGEIPYNWYQSLGLGLSGSNDRGSKKGVWNRKVRWHRLWILEDANRGSPLWEEVALLLLGEKLEAMKAEEWAFLDRQVLGVIRLTLFRFIAHNFVKEKNTADLMKALSGIYEKPSANNKVHLMKKLFN